VDKIQKTTRLLNVVAPRRYRGEEVMGTIENVKEMAILIKNLGDLALQPTI
jgi:hypothetical protein